MEVRPDPEATAAELDPAAEVDIAAIEAAALVPSISEIAEVEDTRGGGQGLEEGNHSTCSCCANHFKITK